MIKEMKFTAVGDALIQKTFDTSYAGAEIIKQYISQGDARFFNYETTINEVGECCASQFSGGSYLRADKGTLDTMKEYGFNITSFNNNHVMDFSYGGLLATLKAMNESEFVHGGVGISLEEASRPVYLDTENGRVAMISVNTTFHSPMMAGNTSPNFPGRPGINGLRINESIVVTEEQMKVVKEIAAQSQINAQKDIERREGYWGGVQEGVANLGYMQFELGEQTARKTVINAADLKRIGASIEEALANADYVMVSLHSHEIEGDSKENPAAFVKEFAHFCIDKGAHAIVGHGPHLMRPIEIYKKRPIFYSLGDFVLQLNDIPCAPADFYEQYGLTPEHTMEELLNKRSNNGTRGLMYNRKMFEAFIPYWETEDGDLTYLELLPIELGFDMIDEKRGIPYLPENTDFMRRLEEISAPYGTKFKTENGVITCEL